MSIIFRRSIAASIEQLCEEAAKADTKETNTDWLFVLPLYHFSKHSSEPFMPPEYNPEIIVFNTGLLDRLGGNWRLPQGWVSTLKENIHTMPVNSLYPIYRSVNDLYADLELLFAADPVLLNVFIALCPKEDYLSLFRKIPTYLSLTWLSHLPGTVKSINSKDVGYFHMLLFCVNT